METTKNDLELIAGFKAGDDSCFEELISRYSGKAFSMASRLTKSTEDAEEVLQDVFITVYRKIDSFEGKSSFSSWLYRITFNASLMKLRKRRQDHSVPMEDVLQQVQNIPSAQFSHGTEGDDKVLQTQVAWALQEAISRLPDDYRPVFVLRDIDGLTSKEVGKILNMTIPAVKSRLHRARLMLRRKLMPFYRDYSGRESVQMGQFGISQNG